MPPSTYPTIAPIPMTAVATPSPTETDDRGIDALVVAPVAASAAIDKDPAPRRSATADPLWPGVRAGLVAAAAYIFAAIVYWFAASTLWAGGHTAGIIVSDALSWHLN